MSTGKAAGRYGIVVNAIRRMLKDDDGLTSTKLAKEVGQTVSLASQYIVNFRHDHPEARMVEAKLKGRRIKHWFSSQFAADAFMARDPSVRVVGKTDTVRVVVAKAVVEVPRHAARRVAREILEAMEC